MHLIGHPILGESLYCHVDFSVSDPNLCLWSTQVILPHPQHFVSNDGSNVFKYDENMLSDRELFVEFRIQEPSRYEEIRRMHAEEWQRKQSEGKT